MKIKRLFSLILVLIFVISTAVIPASADGTHASKAAVAVDAGRVVQGQFTVSSTAAYYKITATDNMYYKFTFTNQSVELKTGISIADDFLNLFFGKYDVKITDQYDSQLANLSVKCGYMGNVSLKLTKGQTYYINLTTNADGYYKMQVEAFKDIAGNSWQTAASTESVGQLISSIDAEGDKDWFTFQTDDTDSYYDFSLENISGSSRMYMYLYEYVEGAGQTPLRETFNISAYSSNTSKKQLKLKSNTKYYLSIYSSSGIGGYQVDIMQTLDAVADTQDKAFEVETDTKITTALDGRDDIDFYRFTTKDYDAYYYFNIDNLSIDNTYYIYLYDVNGNQIDYASTYSSYDLSLNERLEPNTEYYFLIKSTSSGVGNYAFTITDIADPFENTRAEAGKIELDTEVRESIGGYGDVDFYKFTTKDYYAYYYFDIENLSLDNTYYIYLYDVSGNQIDYASTYSSYNLSLNERLEPNTEYYFCIKASGNGVGNYKVIIIDVADQYKNTHAEAAEIELNTEVSESIGGYGDVDYYKFTTKGEKAYYYFNIENVSFDNTYFIYLYDAKGNEIGYKSTYSSYDLTYDKKLEPNTEYYFCIKAASSGTGEYIIKLTYSLDAEGDVKEEATEISLNESLTCELSSDSDIDWFKFTLPYDMNIRLATVNESGNSKIFVVYSRIDKQVISYTCYDDGSKTAILDAGEYYLKVYNNEGYYTFAIADCGSAHKQAERYFKATTEADGIKTTYCKSCNTQIKKEVIPRIEKVTLSYTETVYNGKPARPEVKVYDSNGKVIAAENYSVSYPSNCADVGVHTAVVEFTGAYEGTVELDYKVTGGQLKQEYGEWYYYDNGVQSYETAVIEYLGERLYIKNGIWNDTLNSTVECGGKYYTIKNGKVTHTYSKVCDATCNDCGKERSVEHTYKKYKTTDATTSKNGKKYYKCEDCGATKTSTIYKASKIKLSTEEYTYNGKTKKPSVKIYTSKGKKLTEGDDYKLSRPKSSKKVGKYKIKITFKGDYTGTKSIYYTINPKGTKVSSVSAAKKSLKVKISKQSTQTTGYQIQYSTSSKFKSAKTKTISSYKTTSYTIKSLKAKKTYYVRVRTYKTVDGEKYYSDWSKAVKKKTK